jgi:WD40 repeat protein
VAWTEDPEARHVAIWSRDGDLIRTVPTDASVGLEFDPTGARVATIDPANVTTIWDARDWSPVARLPRGALDVNFSPDGSTIATGNTDGTVRLYDAASGAPRLTLRGHEWWVTSVDFSPDGTKLASQSAGTVRVWALDVDDLLAIAEEVASRSFTDEECRRYLHVDRCTD